MVEAKVLVPSERVAEFYEMYGRWLGGVGGDEASGSAMPWGKIDEDLPRAQIVWGKLSQNAQALFTMLMDEPGKKFTGELLATELDIPHGMYGVAGVLAWPRRHCAAVGRELPVHAQEGPVGESAKYWMTEELAALFRRPRDSQ